MAYLLPLWLRRSEFYSAEKKVAPVDQVIRPSAKNPEIPGELPAELHAGGIVQKGGKAQHRLARNSIPLRLLGLRRRRAKQICSISLLVIVGMGFLSVFASWPTAVLITLLACGGICVAILSGINSLVQMNSRRPSPSSFSPLSPLQNRENAKEWTPRSLPVPLEKKSESDSTVLPSHDELVRAARAKALVERPEDFAGQGLAEVSLLGRANEDSEPKGFSNLNLDEVLRRRRAV